MISARHKIIDSLHLFVLVSFALAQPLYDLLGRYADFFVAHGSGYLTLLCLVGVVSILIPVLLVLIEAGADLFFGERFRRFVHLGFSGILAGLIVIPPLNRWGILPDIVVYLTAVLSGGVFILLYTKWKIMRSFLTALTPAILIFPAYFLFFTPVQTLVFHKKASPFSDIDIHNTVPVILIVFDEFNTMALLNKEGVIDSVRYPNFASLAGESWWFPNAICSSLETTKSIPAILTGKTPSMTKKKLATYADHPLNLFTLLAGQYYLNIIETEPSIRLDTIKKYARVFEFNSFVSDIRMLYRVLFLPGSLKNSSNYFDGRWKGFTSTVSPEDPDIPSGILFRKKQIEGFINGIRADKHNQLNFMHLSLPHVPYEYLSSGTSYNNTTILPDGIISEDAGWGNAAELVEVAYQRYLQQVGYTDKVLGNIMAGVKEKGIYDESLIIITADHGVSMQPNRSRRSYYEGNQHEILKVPTFLKLPNQKQADVCHDLVSGVDILPTIAGVLGITLPWDHDGGPMVPGITGVKNTIRADKVRVTGLREFSLRDIEGFPLFGWKTSVFGSGTPLTQLVRRDPNQALLGREIKDLDIRSIENPFTIEVENIDQFKNIEPGSGYLPALLRGHVTNFTTKGQLALAIALNGKIRATTSTSQWHEENAFFTVLFPEAAFQQGRNELDIFMIKGSRSGRNPYLVRIPIANPENIILLSNKAGGESLIFENGREVPVNAQPAEGFLDNFHLNEFTVLITGWAFDKKAGLPVQSIVLFSGNQYIAQANPDIGRNDIISYLGTDKAKYSGFQFRIPKYIVSGEKIRAFGITKKGVAFELKITVTAGESMEKYFRNKF